MAHLIDAGCVEPRSGDERLCATRGGWVHLARLLRLEVDPGAAALRAFCTTLKLALLHLVQVECRRESVATLLNTGRRRADALEMAAWAGGGPLLERCLALEQEREALELRGLQQVAASQRLAEGIDEIVA